MSTAMEAAKARRGGAHGPSSYRKMTFFPDLSAYDNDLTTPLDRVKNIGWLAKHVDFPKAEPRSEFIEALQWCCCHCNVNQMRGTHYCDFCDQERIECPCETRPRVLGSAEIWIPGSEVIYAAPNLVLHYVQQHWYAPPVAFIEAVLAQAKAGPPKKDLYKAIMSKRNA